MAKVSLAPKVSCLYKRAIIKAGENMIVMRRPIRNFTRKCIKWATWLVIKSMLIKWQLLDLVAHLIKTMKLFSIDKQQQSKVKLYLNSVSLLIEIFVLSSNLNKIKLRNSNNMNTMPMELMKLFPGE